jgi:thiosulfate/3-mercaptopyruvate sulfurtransferase
VREGRPTRGGEETRPARQYEAALRPALYADVGNVVSHLDEPGRLLIDARAPERFEGRSETIDRVAGHIPGAINHFFKQNLAADGTMLPPDLVRANFESLLGGQPPDRVVMYCGSGVTACQNLLAMEHAGLPGARLYVGSWSEWSGEPARPVETGPSRRT